MTDDIYKRRRRLAIDGPFLASLIGQGMNAIEAEEQVPDLQIMHATYELDAARVILYVCSSTFDTVPEGEESPPWTPSFRNVVTE